jgi:hypothetical protein
MKTANAINEVGQGYLNNIIASKEAHDWKERSLRHYTVSSQSEQSPFLLQTFVNFGSEVKSIGC